MPRKPTEPHSFQEALVASFARQSISKVSTFHPDQWGNGREPADMIICIGRALFFVNMTEGKSYFSNLCNHNLDQACKRIEDWKMGQAIRGYNQWRSFEVSWPEVESIAVVSVIDGPHAACIDHPLENRNFDPKVHLCSTLTRNVFQALADRNGGARDLIDLCASLKGRGKRTAQEVIAELNSKHQAMVDRAIAGAGPGPQGIGHAVVQGRALSVFDEFLAQLYLSKSSDISSLKILSDVNWSDALSLSAFITRSIAELQISPRGQVKSHVVGNVVKLQVVVFRLADVGCPALKQAISTDCPVLWSIPLELVRPPAPSDSFVPLAPLGAQWALREIPKVWETEIALKSQRMSLTEIA